MTLHRATKHVNMGDGLFLPPGAQVNISEDDAGLVSGLEPVLERPDDKPILERPDNRRNIEAPKPVRPWETQQW